MSGPVTGADGWTVAQRQSAGMDTDEFRSGAWEPSHGPTMAVARLIDLENGDG